MAKVMREQKELRETETDWQGIVYETRFFVVSKATYKWLEQYGCLAAVSLCDWETHPTISISAEVTPTGWNGWNWAHDEFAMAGLNLGDYA